MSGIAHTRPMLVADANYATFDRVWHRPRPTTRVRASTAKARCGAMLRNPMFEPAEIIQPERRCAACETTESVRRNLRSSGISTAHWTRGGAGNGGHLYLDGTPYSVHRDDRPGTPPMARWRVCHRHVEGRVVACRRTLREARIEAETRFISQADERATRDDPLANRDPDAYVPGDILSLAGET